MLLSSHLLNEVELIADEMILIGHGKIVAQGDKKSLLAGAAGVGLDLRHRAGQPGAVHGADGARASRSPAPATGLRVETEPVEVGRTAVEHQIVLTDLRAADGGLEDLFLELTSDTQREVPRMSATAAPGLGHALDLSSTTPTPFLRLVRVELRKTWDTRAGLWLLISTAVLTAAVMVIQLAVVVVQDLNVSYNDFLTSTNFSIGLLLPVIGILLLTSEWSQRTAMVTFSLEPRRPLVIAAKFVVGIGLAIAAVVIALVLATICNALYGALSGPAGRVGPERRSRPPTSCSSR